MSSSLKPDPLANRVRIVVATSVMLTFISYWRAAAIVLNDLGSSAFYAAGIAEQAVGKSAAWFIVAVMLFSFTVRAVYVESCSMFVRGGVYRVVKEALGGTLAKISVSALMFDYILTGPISGVSAGQYIAGLINSIFVTMDAHGWVPGAMHAMFHGTPQVNVNVTSVVFALAVTLYFWWQNIKGIQESSEKALQVMKITTVMVVILLAWSVLTVLKNGYQPVPLPFPHNLKFGTEALGFLKHTDLAQNLAQKFGLLGILIAFGHSVLAMSGEESLAQVNRELAHPKLKNLKRAAIIIAIYSFMFTGLTALLFVMIIPDSVRIPVYKDNLIAGLAMYLWGPPLLRLVFRAFVVLVGFLILSGAVNTAIIGSNGVLNRVSEDGVLADWFRQPHKRFGTSYRIINMVVLLQVFTILASRGDVYVLGEAYAFGVIWSFTFNSLAMLVLRFKYHGERGWKVPPNFHIAGHEIPVGLASVFLVLFATAVVNLFTKSIATVAGVAFTGVFFVVFAISERANMRKHALAQQQMREHFQLQHTDTVERSGLGIRPGNVLVTVRDYNTLNHLKWALERIDTKEQDIVVMSARVSQFGAAAYDLSTEQIFSEYEQHLFTRAVSVAESYGKHVSLLVVPARDVWSAIVQTAINLESSAVVSGLSSKMTSQEQAFELGRAWEAAPEPKRQFVFQVVRPGLTVDTFRIGPHTPTMKTEDVHQLHRLWLQISREPGMDKLHHHDILTQALSRFAREYSGRSHEEILDDLRRATGNSSSGPGSGSGLGPESEPSSGLGSGPGSSSSPGSASRDGDKDQKAGP
jgi:amino acid transporter